ncbi:choline phosphate cytidylyltransferase [Lecanora helva]
MEQPKSDLDVPTTGNWPVDPQNDVVISKDRIWVDGCFDFAHHGHAGAMLQARRLGKELVVGVHSDEDIMDNKGPTVMTLKERIAAVDACRWATKSIPCAPYVTSLPWISHYGCQYVVHGDDITSDAGGEDCYRFVKAAGRFLVVKRTPGISTTDLVGRMLLCTRNHFIKSLPQTLAGEEGSGGPEERRKSGEEMRQRIRDYATDDSGLKPGPQVLHWEGSRAAMKDADAEEMGSYRTMVSGTGPRPGQRIVYVDGGFDLFSSGHIEFLHQVQIAEEALARKIGWYNDSAKSYSPAYIVAGVHDDEVINHWKGVNYPIMNIFERGLCYVDAVILSAPFTPSKAYLKNLPYGTPAAVYHGPTTFMPLTYDPYVAAKELSIYREVGEHDFQNVNAGEIVQRILRSREIYEARQRAKGEKTSTEEAVKRREALEQDAASLEKERAENR